MSSKKNLKFHIEFLSTAQKMAWAAFQQHDVLFLSGPAGVGKTYLSMAFAISEILNKKRSKIILTRPIIEAGERLGFLPGDFEEKVNPYMRPLYDCMDKMVGDISQKEIIKNSIEIAPIAFMRGRSFDDAVCIFDESQNATKMQLKLFLTRLGKNSKLIITGDPNQSDIGYNSGFVDVMQRLEILSGIGIIRFKNESIVRHELVSKIIERLEERE